MVEETFGTFTKDGQVRVAYTPAEAVNLRARGFVQVNDAEPVVSDLPPKSGRGSGREVWVAYAEQHGIEVPEDATREEVIEAVEAQ